MKLNTLNILLTIFCTNIKAQKLVTYTYSNLGINATSGYKKIDDSGAVILYSKKTFITKDTGLTKIIQKPKEDIAPIFSTVDSITTMHKTIKTKPSTSKSYGANAVFYTVNKKQIVLFYSPTLLPKEKNKGTVRLYNLYKKLLRQIQMLN